MNTRAGGYKGGLGLQGLGGGSGGNPPRVADGHSLDDNDIIDLIRFLVMVITIYGCSGLTL